MDLLAAQAALYEQMAQDDQAAAAYERARRTCASGEDSARKLALLERFGQMERARGEYASSTAILEEAISLWQAQDADSEAAQAMALIGANYADAGEIDAALAYYADMIDVAQKAGDTDLAVTVLRVQGDLYQNLEQYEDAVDSYDAALAIATEQKMRPVDWICCSSSGSFNGIKESMRHRSRPMRMLRRYCVSKVTRLVWRKYSR